MPAPPQSKAKNNFIFTALGSSRLPVLVGSGACLWLFFLKDSFWRDESKLLLNVIQKSFIGLAGTLDYGQEAPLILLWFYRIIYLAGGQSELTFRFLSLLATICSIWLFQKLARNFLREKYPVIFATWLFALSPGVIFFAAQAKQYALDVLISTLLLWLASATLFSATPARKKLFWLALAGGLAPWVSLPSVFTVPFLLILVFCKTRESFWRRLRLCLPGAVSCFLVALLVLSRSLDPEKSQLAFAFPLLSHDFGSEKGALLLYTATFGYLGLAPSPYLFWSFFGHEVPLPLLVLLLLSLLGIMIPYKRFGWSLPVLLAGPLTAAWFLLALAYYPMLGRAFLFATPAFFLLAGFGLIYLLQSFPYRLPAYLILLFLLLPPADTFSRSYSRPVGGVREALEFIVRHQQPKSYVICDPYAASTVACYRALQNPAAKKLIYLRPPLEWVEGKIDPGQINPGTLLLPYSSQPVWLLAETKGYTRSGISSLTPFATRILQYLADSRKLEFSYATSNVQAQGFAAVSERNPSEKPDAGLPVTTGSLPETP